MQPREKKLAYLLATLPVMWLGWYEVKPWVWGPITIQKNRLAAIETQIKSKEEEGFQVIAASNKMGLWTQQSLPPDENDAQRLYLAWMTSLAQEIGFDELKVSPGRTTTKKKDYIAVQIELEGRTNFERLVRFLHHFEKADLLHRVASLQIDSDSNEGDPLLDIKLTAEGIALLRAPQRSRLFPSTKLSSMINAEDTQLNIESAKRFPKSAPFLVRIENEVMKVSNVKGNTWTVRRGEDGSKAIKHSANAEIHLGKYNPLLNTVALQDVVAEHRPLIRNSPFVLPQVFNPLIQNLGKHIIVQDKPVEIKLQVDDYDASMGTPTFQLKENAPTGMKIDEKTGNITWSPTKEDRLGDYSVTVVALQSNGETPIPEGILKLELRKFNNKPVIVNIEDKEVFPGQSVAFQASATDKDDTKEPEGKIKYSLKDSPEGATIDEATGKFKWEVAEDFKPGEYRFAVVVTDEGTPAEFAEENLTITVLKDAARDVQLIGIVGEDKKEKEAWFRNQDKNENIVLKKGSAFEWGTVKGTVTEIGQDFVLFRSKQSLWKIELRQTIGEMQIVAKTPTGKTGSRNKIAD